MVESFSITIVRRSATTRELLYREAGKVAAVYLERAAIPGVEWVGSESDLDRWSDPAGEPIAATQTAEILARIRDWSRENRLRADIGPAMTRDEFFARETGEGWTLKTEADGTVLATPPDLSFLKRLKRFLSTL